MRPRRRPAIRLLVSVTVLGSIAAAAWLTVRPLPAREPAAVVTAGSWQGLVGDAHPAVSLGGADDRRAPHPSVAQRLARVKLASEAAERRWSAEDVRSPAAGAHRARPPRPQRAARLQLLPRARRLLGPCSTRARSRCSSTTPRSPASTPCGSRSRRRSRRSRRACGQPGRRGRTARPRRHRDLDRAARHRGRPRRSPTWAAASSPGSTSSAAAATPPRSATRRRQRVERHGTELAGMLVGSGGPDGVHGVAPGATVLPIRVAGWQPDRHGRDAVYARSDQLIAGLERAVDPNGDGDTHDARPDRADRRGRAVRLLRRQPRGAGGGGRARARRARGRSGRERRRRRAAVRLDRRPRRVARRAHRRGDRLAREHRGVRVVLSQGLNVLADSSLPLLVDGALGELRWRPRVAVPGDPAALAGKAALVAAGANPAATVAAAVGDGATAVLALRPPASARLARRSPASPWPPSPRLGAARCSPRSGSDSRSTAALGGPRPQPNPAAGLARAPSRRAGSPSAGCSNRSSRRPGIGILTSDPGSAGDGEPAFASVTGTSVAAASRRRCRRAARPEPTGTVGRGAREPARRLGAAGGGRPAPREAPGRSMSARAPSARWRPRRPRSGSAPGRARTGARPPARRSTTSPPGG